MRTLIDEILTVDTTPAVHSCGCNCTNCISGKTTHPTGCNCAQCQQPVFLGSSFLDEMLLELNGSALEQAVAFNRKNSASLGWGKYLKDISVKLLGLSASPDEQTFAKAVSNWQVTQGLSADGKLGSGTWGKMRQLLGLSSISTPSTSAVSTPYPRVYPMPVLSDGRKPQITSGHWSVNPSRPNHYGADIMYQYLPGKDPDRKELESKRRMDRNSRFWTPEGIWAMAFAPGKVTFVVENTKPNNGWIVNIMHPDGLQSRYLHLTKPIVKNGDSVNAGDRLAELDRRGSPAHLHFEIRRNGKYGLKDSVDPTPYLVNLPFRSNAGATINPIVNTPSSPPRQSTPNPPAGIRTLIPLLNKYRGEIPLHFLLGWIKIESDGNNAVITRLNERGYFQIHPEESKDLGFDHNRITTDKDYSIQSGIQLVRHKMKYADRTSNALGIPKGSDLYWHIVKLWHWVPLCVDVITKEMLAQAFKPRTWEEFRSFMLNNRDRIKELVISRAKKWNKAWDVTVGINNVEKVFTAANAYRIY